ncbi:VTC4 [Sanghuangporus weigelae]
MKFGRKINADLYNEWREYYLDYNKLKRELKSRTTSHVWNDEDESEFIRMLEVELDKIHDFQKHKTTELARRISSAEERVHRLVKEEEAYHASFNALNGTQIHPETGTRNGYGTMNDIEGQRRRVDADEVGSDDGSDEDSGDDDDRESGKSSDTFEEQFRWLEEEVATLVADVHDLTLYSKLNLTGFMKILKSTYFSFFAPKKQTARPVKETFIHSYLDKRPFYKYNWDGLIVKLSKLYDLVRTRGHPTQGDPTAGGNQSAFVRQTTKYWVHPDNLVHLKLAILRHLPVLVFNPKKDFEQKDAAITSIYLDNEDLELYLGRLEKTEGAEAIRLRWYGDMEQKQIFVERKTHREDWTGEKSVKARFPIKEENVNAFLRGEYTIDEEFRELTKKGKKSQQEIESMVQLATEVQYSIITRKLKPVMRTFYNRTAFQLPGDARVRISLDTELSMIREDNWDGRARSGNNWRRMDIGTDHPFPQLPPEDKELFKYGVLEVKLQTQYGQEPPEWVTELVQSHLVEAVPKFSKFIHGCATLLPHRVDLVPFWLPQMDIDILKPDTGKMHIERPSHSATASVAETPGAATPDYEAPRPYTEPVSEGEDDEYALQPARDEDKATEIPQRPTRRREENDEGDDYVADDERAPLMSGRRRASQPTTATAGSALHKSQRGLSIDPLAPSQAFDQTFRNRLAKAASSEQDESAIDDPDSEAVMAPAGRRLRGDDRELVRFWKSAPGQRIAVPVRIEPKVYFASERTFLTWLQFSVLIGTISTGLLNFIPPGDTRGLIAAGFFTFAALLAIAYSCGIFVYRSFKLRKRHAEGLYYDKWGPTILCVALAAALLTNVGLRIGDM